MLARLKWLAVALLLGAAALTIAHQFGMREQRLLGRSDQLQADIQKERERAADDAQLRKLSDYDFCMQSLRRRGLQSADCEQLRGLAQE